MEPRIPGAQVSSECGPAGGSAGGSAPRAPPERAEGPAVGATLHQGGSPCESRCGREAQHSGAGWARAPTITSSMSRAKTTAPPLQGSLPGALAPATRTPAPREGTEAPARAGAPTPVTPTLPRPFCQMCRPAHGLQWGEHLAGPEQPGCGAGAELMAQMWQAPRPPTQAALSARSDPRP